MEICPNCGSHFPATKAWASDPVLAMLTGWGSLSMRVRCPNCRHVFPATGYRFFGIFSPRAIQLFSYTLILAIGCGAIYFVYFE